MHVSLAPAPPPGLDEVAELLEQADTVTIEITARRRARMKACVRNIQAERGNDNRWAIRICSKVDA